MSPARNAGGDGAQADRRERRALDAGWRAKPVASGLPGWATIDQDIDVSAPDGTYPAIDALAEKLSAQGRLTAGLPERFGAPAAARVLALSNAKTALHLAGVVANCERQQRHDAGVIAKRIKQMIRDMSEFAEFVSEDQAWLFLLPEDEPPDGERKPHEWLFDRGYARLAEAHEALKCSASALEILHKASGTSPGYRYDGAKDALVAEFLLAMATAWEVLTGDAPGKTGSGLFHQFCVGAWQMLGWPEAKESRGERYDQCFARAIERGVHLRE